MRVASGFCSFLSPSPSRLAFGPSETRGWRAGSAHTCSVRDREIAAGAVRRATCAQAGQRPIAHAHFAASIGSGPRFSPGLPVRNLRASSWRGLVVAPGGAPPPPGCPIAIGPAGAAPRPAYATPRDGAPQWTRWVHHNGGSEGEDKDSIPPPCGEVRRCRRQRRGGAEPMGRQKVRSRSPHPSR